MKNKQSLSEKKETLILETSNTSYETLLQNYYTDLASGVEHCPDELELAFFFEDLFDLINLECANELVH